MASTSLISIPNEILIAITDRLSLDDLCTLCRISKTAYTRIQGILLERAGRTRRYTVDSDDLRILYQFSTHPQRFNLLLRKLEIDIRTPYTLILPAKEEIEELPEPDQIRRLKIHEAVNTSARKLQMRTVHDKIDLPIKLLCASLRNFPNLEVVDIICSKPSSITRKTLQRYYPKFLFEPGIFTEFWELLRPRMMRYNFVYLEYSAALNFILDVLEKTPLPSLKEVNLRLGAAEFLAITPGQLADDITGRYRNSNTDAEQSRIAHSLIHELELPVSAEPYIDQDALAEIDIRVHCLSAVVKCLTDRFVGLEKLVYSSPRISPLRPDRHPKYKYYMPSLILSEPKLFLPNLKTLHLINQPLLEQDLVDLLIAHKATLRSLVLKWCALQSATQFWSPVFQLLESDLSLTEFFFDGLKCYADYKCIPWIRVRGDVRSDSYRCELVPGSTDELNFRTAMEMIRVAESVLESYRGTDDGQYLETIYPMLYIKGNRSPHPDDAEIEPLDGNTDHPIFTSKVGFRRLRDFIAQLYYPI